MQSELQKLLTQNYNNLQDKHQLENLILQHKTNITHLVQQTHQLVTLKDKEQLEHDIILNKMQENMLENTRQIIHFKNLVNQTTEQHQKMTKELEDDKDKTRKAAQIAHHNELNELLKKCDDLEHEYRQMQTTEDTQTALLHQIEHLQEGLITRQYQHHDHMNREEKKQVHQNQELAKENVERVVQVKKNVYQVARNQVVQEKATNQQNNDLLKQQLKGLQQQLAVLRKQRNELLGKRKEMRINISINEEELEEYKAVGSLQKAKIKAHKDKIEALKTQLTEEVTRRQAKINQLKKTRATEGKALKARLLSLQREQQELKIKIEQMKILADTILMQRQEVQQFFIMALEGCKKEIEHEKEGSLAVGKDKETRNYGEKVDIDELSAKDKQRILTNLYTKLALGP